MAFFNSTVGVPQILIVALDAGFGIWGCNQSSGKLRQRWNNFTLRLPDSQTNCPSDDSAGLTILSHDFFSRCGYFYGMQDLPP